MLRFSFRLRRYGAACVSAVLLCAQAASAAEREWLKLNAPSFGVISQLDEQETLAWAVELDQFIGALHALYKVDQVALPPLTIVLFRGQREFAPYRLRTESGQARIAAFFGNTGDWSVIGMPGHGVDAATRETLYHEAVHWFATAANQPQPLWFAEGLAEVLSTFEVVDGKGRWGRPVGDNVRHLAETGLLPMQQFLQASQDDALHGDAGDQYYPQAWAFVHSLMFGNGGVAADRLAAFLHALDASAVDTAVDAAFGKSYDELTAELRGYLERGRYGYAEVTLRDSSDEMTVEPASQASVEFALGRLATVGGNLELARNHADEVIGLAPHSPAGFELAAYAAHELGDLGTLVPALERAAALGSRESWIYATQADRLLANNQRERGSLDELLPSSTARAAADLYEHALKLRPRNTAALNGLVMALLNVDAMSATDGAALNASRTMFPNDGLLLVGQAAAAKHRGDASAAMSLLQQATAEPFRLPRRYRGAVVALRSSWFGEWFLAEVGALTDAGRFDESRALVAQHLADATITGPLRSMLEGVQRDLPDLERLHTATAAALAGDESEAAAILTELANDPSAGERARREAERILRRTRPRAELR
jgi:tetratricopeptide (TPR) repeat protein